MNDVQYPRYVGLCAHPIRDRAALDKDGAGGTRSRGVRITPGAPNEAHQPLPAADPADGENEEEAADSAGAPRLARLS